METQDDSAPGGASGDGKFSYRDMDDIAKSFQREAEALREIVRGRDQTIKALKAHALCMQSNFKTILVAVVDSIIDADVQFHAKKMIDDLDKAKDLVGKIEVGQ